jgi:ABC-type polysaccharide/polyol phosphate transport system ATPase subunit
MAVIEFEHVSKAYRLGTGRRSLREAMTQLPRRVFGRDGTQAEDQHLWALKDVSFEIEQGEVLGIIGPNGAGKSTILKLLSKVTYPTNGQIRTRGRMAALIELGAGFHPDLTGRENVYLNGAILGLKSQEVDAQFSNIVEFAGLERFIDTPIKRYSSGMYVRLAFAVAAHVKADLLLVDEVLSVGDMAFQQKCLTKMNELRNAGATIVFVSHNLWSVGAFCRRALLLRAGQIEAEGDPDQVIQAYRRQDRETLLKLATHSTDDAAIGSPSDAQGLTGETVITDIELLDGNREPQHGFSSQDQIIIRAHYLTPQQIDEPLFVIHIRRADGVICCTLTNANEENVESIQGEGTFDVRIGPLQLVPNIYTVEVQIASRRQPISYAISHREPLHVKGHIENPDHGGIFEPYAEWLLRE